MQRLRTQANGSSAFYNVGFPGFLSLPALGGGSKQSVKKSVCMG